MLEPQRQLAPSRPFQGTWQAQLTRARQLEVTTESEPWVPEQKRQLAPSRPYREICQASLARVRQVGVRTESERSAWAWRRFGPQGLLQQLREAARRPLSQLGAWERP